MNIIFLILFSLAGYAQTSQTIFDRLVPPLVAAHQGGSPWKSGNNTLPKFEAAINEGVDILEMDLRLTKDGVVIVFHDESLDSQTQCKGKVADKLYSEIAECRYNSSKRAIETFEDVLSAVRGRAVINAEFKEQQVVVASIRLIQSYQAHDWVYFQTKSEKDRYLLSRSLDPKVALLFKATSKTNLEWALALDDPYLVVIEMEKDMATSENIQLVHEKRKLVSVNSWRYGIAEEFFNAACDKVFKLSIDIAVANNTKSCLEQKRHYGMLPF